MKPVVIHAEAEAELEAAAAHYEGRRPGLGREFRLEFEAALARLTANPHLYAIEVDEVRGCPLRRFPYSVYYIDMTDRIWLAAVADQRRRPGYWLRRKLG
ncbi:MAG TPA: type II toxin-antitoxin system RelE/ParE family toxin [Gemmataceae bacterium]|nr:type II toxin-antitoxin system RelE/ParE family toxin [Gemmataceae bacterium]